MYNLKEIAIAVLLLLLLFSLNLKKCNNCSFFPKQKTSCWGPLCWFIQDKSLAGSQSLTLSPRAVIPWFCRTFQRSSVYASQRCHNNAANIFRLVACRWDEWDVQILRIVLHANQNDDWHPCFQKCLNSFCHSLFSALQAKERESSFDGETGEGKCAVYFVSNQDPTL